MLRSLPARSELPAPVIPVLAVLSTDVACFGGYGRKAGRQQCGSLAQSSRDKREEAQQDDASAVTSGRHLLSPGLKGLRQPRYQPWRCLRGAEGGNLTTGGLSCHYTHSLCPWSPTRNSHSLQGKGLTTRTPRATSSGSSSGAAEQATGHTVKTPGHSSIHSVLHPLPQGRDFNCCSPSQLCLMVASGIEPGPLGPQACTHF